MAKTCVTEQSARRQRWIEDGLLELMLQKTYAQISVTDLCAHLQLSRRSFYRYFSDLDDVLDSLLNHTFQNLAIAPMVPTVEELQRSYEFWVAQKPLLDALKHAGLIQRVFEAALYYTAFQPEGDDAKDRQTFILGGFMSLIIAWYEEGFRKTPKEMARTAYRMLYEPFLKKE